MEEWNVEDPAFIGVDLKRQLLIDYFQKVPVKKFVTMTPMIHIPRPQCSIIPTFLYSNWGEAYIL